MASRSIRRREGIIHNQATDLRRRISHKRPIRAAILPAACLAAVWGAVVLACAAIAVPHAPAPTTPTFAISAPPIALYRRQVRDAVTSLSGFFLLSPFSTPLFVCKCQAQAAGVLSSASTLPIFLDERGTLALVWLRSDFEADALRLWECQSFGASTAPHSHVG